MCLYVLYVCVCVCLCVFGYIRVCVCVCAVRGARGGGGCNCAPVYLGKLQFAANSTESCWHVGPVVLRCVFLFFPMSCKCTIVIVHVTLAKPRQRQGRDKAGMWAKQRQNNGKTTEKTRQRQSKQKAGTLCGPLPTRRSYRGWGGGWESWSPPDGL